MSGPLLAWIVPVGGSGGEGLHPSHPIVIPPGSGGTPPGFWGGGPHPVPPVYYPEPPGGGGGGGGTPPGFWGGGPHPTPPVYHPGEPTAPPVDPGYFPPGVGVPVPPEGGGPPTKAYVVAYILGTGEKMTFLVDLPAPTTPTEPTPK